MSFPLNRKNREEKARRDEETQHRLWIVRIQEIMAEKDCTPFLALDSLYSEINLHSVAPQRRQQLRDTWNSFRRKIEALKPR